MRDFDVVNEPEYRSPEQAGGAFVAGTLVRTDRGLIPIDKIRIGDRVLSQPEESGELAYKRVSSAKRHESRS